MNRDIIIKIMRQLIEAQQRLLALLQQKQSMNREKLYSTIMAFLNQDVTPTDVIPDEYACAETANAIHVKAFGFPIGGRASSYLLYQALLVSPYFTKMDEPDKGDIIISPTGTRTRKSPIPNGHVGFVIENNQIAANNSQNGKFQITYTIDSWRERYEVKGGYPVYFFRRI